MTALRSMGLRTIMYIDDILILAELETQAREHMATLLFLLENLGLVINHPKSQTMPSQVIEFLGFNIDSTTMELKLPGDKIKKIRGEARRLLSQTDNSALALSRFLGKLNHAILPAPTVLQDPFEGSTGQRGSRLQQNSPPERGVHSGANMVGNSPESMEPDISTPYPDDRNGCLHDWVGSLLSGEENGRGVVPNRERCMLRIVRSYPSSEMLCQRAEQSSYPTENGQHNGHLVHKQTRGHSLSSTESANKGLVAMVYDQEHHAKSSPPKLNVVADEESRLMKEWQLCPEVFQMINERLGPLQIDLFASRLSNQLPQYVTRPGGDSHSVWAGRSGRGMRTLHGT